MNLSEMVASTYARLGTDSRDGLLTPATIQSFLNDGLDAYEAEGDWPWLQTSESISTVAGTSAYATATDWMETLDLRQNDNGDGLTERQYGDLETNWDPTTRGRPAEYAIYAEQLQLRPVPDGVYVLNHRYIKFEPRLGADTDTPALLTAFHAGLVEYATYLSFRRLNDPTRAQMAYAEWDHWRTRLRRHRRRYGGPTNIKVRPGRGL